jgi:hypothetical protein
MFLRISKYIEVPADAAWLIWKIALINPAKPLSFLIGRANIE